ncbi:MULTISPECIES: NlpC/P60 family protein [Lelliottia]|jgi:lipoprotein Spr|uniref:NlpC/P60 family protein n=1 Tax=Lelliottia TaxID=1330545 RepID=UPI00249EBBC0|nr:MULTISPECIES: NlpC/P60 family protein [unclassified Lelliottia]MDI3361037.1 NlpC/P60 family protein [Lelliottia sp. V89_13]MDK9549651.1 NlpC/P60 family protein [Lelliottia sp. V89_5]MDK9583490.1 NlpC/P60 family protein [Lelliottia sp. V86_10]MDK9595650.1 NlpC/P60 family protein [Lelliottia sp. V89_10]MDK9606916.1 NlpC/P60 family protein [Lelliottia sp. V104_15]
MTFRLLFSTLLLSFASFSAFSFELPASMLSHQHQLSLSPAKTSLEHQEPGQLRGRILAQYQQWKGTHYVWGGTSHRGVDCSALMQHLFSEAADLSLPRTTGEQINRGVQVAEYRLKAGDLIFFQTGPHRRHVGVYIGHDQFIHASTSQGVTVSTLANNYWHSHFITARRVTGSNA